VVRDCEQERQTTNFTPSSALELLKSQRARRDSWHVRVSVKITVLAGTR
jgi:hypothetical protein